MCLQCGEWRSCLTHQASRRGASPAAPAHSPECPQRTTAANASWCRAREAATPSGRKNTNNNLIIGSLFARKGINKFFLLFRCWVKVFPNSILVFLSWASTVHSFAYFPSSSCHRVGGRPRYRLFRDTHHLIKKTQLETSSPSHLLNKKKLSKIGSAVWKL